MNPPVRLTQFSSGAGCGCKISPQVLDAILAGSAGDGAADPRLLVGNAGRDDAAAWLLEDGDTVLLATTDFFMPIADDPFDFGRIASANAISDIYAMGGRPVLALAVLGWPLDKLPPETAREVIAGARAVCKEAGIVLAGGHSIDSAEPLFGLAVNGIVPKAHLKTNAGARPGDVLFLTKPLGVGLLATALKNGRLRPGDENLASASMVRLNRVGTDLAAIPGVHALTDVTGFGFLGHLLELCRASGVDAALDFAAIPLITDLGPYVEAGLAPGGTRRNWAGYGEAVGPLDAFRQAVLCDPQTSGGLLVAVAPDALVALAPVFACHGLADFLRPVGTLSSTAGSAIRVSVA